MELEELETAIGYSFSDRSLLEQALTHPSLRNERQLAGDNQRMEYLGDAVLGLVSAEYLYQRHQNLPEGRLTVMRSAATSAPTLADIARAIDLGSFLRLGRGEESSGGRQKENNLADALEALIGAIYLDGGYDHVQMIFSRLFSSIMDSMEIADSSDNPKGRLQEWAQKNGLPCPTYHVVKEEGPPHQRWFTIQVIIDDPRQAIGAGPTKRSAEADAARNLNAVVL